MLTSRRIILIGFPVLLLLLGLVGADLIVSASSDEREAARVAAEEETEAALDNLRMRWRQFVGEREAECVRIANEQARQREMILTKASVLLREALQRLAASEAAKVKARPAAEGETSGLASLLASLGFAERRATPPVPVAEPEPLGPMPALENARKDLAALLPLAGGMLRVKDAEGVTLWQEERHDLPLQKPAEQRVRFAWAGGEETWVLSAGLAVAPPPAMEAPQMLADLAVEMLDEGHRGSDTLSLAAITTSGEVLTTLRRGSTQVSLALTQAIGAWQEQPATLDGRRPVRYVSVRPSPDAAGWGFLATTTVQEVPTFDWLLTRIDQRPLLGLAPMMALAMAIAAVVWALRRPSTRSSGSRQSSPRRKLVRRGERDVPEETDRIFADLSKADGSIHFQMPPASARVTRPSPDRESNLLRLRAIYRDDGEAFDLDSRVRSDVLRGLLQEVRTGTRPTAEDD